MASFEAMSYQELLVIIESSLVVELNEFPEIDFIFTEAGSHKLRITFYFWYKL